jgi:hypothetical protein
MDWLSTIDSVLIQSNQIPRHVNHTGFGMYLLFGWTHRIATRLGWVSLTGLDSLRTAANPVLASAQLTDFFRLHSPLALTAIVACSFSLVSRLSPSSRDARAGRLWATLAVLLLGLQEGLFYHAAMVRTELYALLSWVIGLLLGASALRTEEAHRARPRWMGAGFFLFLAFMTKIQSFVLLFWGAGLWIFAAHIEPPRCLQIERVEKRSYFSCLLLALVLITLVISAWTFTLPPGLVTFASEYPLNSAAVVFLALYATPWLAGRLFGVRARALEAVLWGGIAAVFAHFLVFGDPLQSWRYALIDVKMVFFRTKYQDLNRIDTLLMLQSIKREISYVPTLFLAHTGLLIAALFSLRNRRTRLVIVALELLLLFNLGVGTRYILRDLIWKHLPLVLWNLSLSAAVLTSGRRPSLRPAVLLLLTLQLAGQLSQVAWMPKRLDAVYTRYGWDPLRWFRPGYPLPDGSFPSIPEPDLMRMEAFQARNWEKIRNDASYVIVNAHVSLTRIGVFANQAALDGREDRRLGEIPPELRGSMTIALNSLEPQPFGLIPDRVRAASEVQEKIRTIRDSADLPIALSTRADLSVFLFVPESVSLPTDKLLVEQPWRIRVGNSRFRSVRLDGYWEVPRALARDSFVVVQDSLAPESLAAR